MPRPVSLLFFERFRLAGSALAICLALTNWASGEPLYPWGGRAPHTLPVNPRTAPRLDSRQGPAVRPETVRRAGSTATGTSLVLTVHEQFLDEWLRVESQEVGPVRDCVLGAAVLGCQRTDSRLRVDCLPDPQQGRIDLQLRGVTRNQTENRTNQAVILASGEHHFLLSKLVRFDGIQLVTRSPAAYLYPHQVNRGAVTPTSAIPILGPLSNQMALTIANQRRPDSERITADRITQQVAPQFNRSVDERLSELNAHLRDGLPGWLSSVGIERPTPLISTTDQELRVGLHWPQTAVSSPLEAAPLRETPRLRLELHENLINATIDQLHIEGKRIPVETLAAWQDSLESQLRPWMPAAAPTAPAAEPTPALPLPTATDRRRPPTASVQRRSPPVRTVSDDWLGQLGLPTELTPTPDISGSGEGPALPLLAPPKTPAMEPEPTQSRRLPALDRDEPERTPELTANTTIILAARDPLRLAFADGQATLTLTAAFQMGIAPATDFYTIRIPIRATVTEDQLIWTPVSVTVEPVTPASGPLAEVTRAAIRSQFESRLKPLSFPAKLQVPRDSRNPMTLQCRRWEITNGWLTIEEEIVTP